MKRNSFSLRIIVLIILVCFISSYTVAQKNKLDTLDVDKLNVYKDKAVKMRFTGMILTLCGVGMVAAGIIVVDKILLVVPSKNTGDPDAGHRLSNVAFAVIGISFLNGIPTTVVGIPLWAIGGIKKSKTEIAIQKINKVPEDSLALGLGITIKF